MSAKEIESIIGKEATRHPAFKSFVWCMRRKRYGDEETASAWYFFRDGWNAYDVEKYKDEVIHGQTAG